jgi:phage terminase small subunit
MEEWILTCQVRQLRVGNKYLEKGDSIRTQDVHSYQRYLDLGALSKKQVPQGRDTRKGRRVVQFSTPPEGRHSKVVGEIESTTVGLPREDVKQILQTEEELMLRVELIHNRVEDIAKHLSRIDESLSRLDSLEKFFVQLDEKADLSLKEVLALLESLKEESTEEPKKKSKRSPKRKSSN